jgi:predicted PhzF superfamily epimerase YddE/YHI9
MTKMPYWHVDAFTDRVFGGGPAAIMQLGAWLDDDVLVAIAAEHNFADTAFLVRDASGAADYELRWFTPKLEVRLCGHATLAAGHVLLGRDPAREAVRFRTRHVGEIAVHRRERGYELAAPAIATARAAFPQAVAGLGAAPREVWRSPHGYEVFLYDIEDQVRGLQPDMRALAALGHHQLIATAPGRETDVVSRVFIPGAGVDEDPVTGSAHAVLTPFWAAKLGRERFTAYQASARGARLTCRLDGDQAWIGGECVTVVEGTFTL